MTIYPQLITDALRQVRYPGNGKNLVEAGMVEDDLRIDGMDVSFSSSLTNPLTRSSSRSSSRPKPPFTPTWTRPYASTYASRPSNKPAPSPERCCLA